ncbi:hypothetical protein KDI_32850 [Dictyobacter arantiisoli]|uniref:Uncharacterized protein n=1 Tax=Dictyobacter arantiisoli TaxID=2014874 RepID=A0A5A5TDU5_9CHLR|nr:hypothetical protein KDI_32850 [Dictyobacter arantiisoli]
MIFLPVSIALVLIVLFMPSIYTEAHVSSNVPSPLSTKQGSWLTHNTTLRNQIIHYTQVETLFVKHDTGQNYTSTLLGNVWLEVDAQGHVQVAHTIYTSLDEKVFHQEIYEDGTTNIVVFGKNDSNHPSIKNPTASSNTTCLVQSPANTVQIRDMALPSFVNLSDLQKQGYVLKVNAHTKSQNVPTILVTTKALPVKQYVTNAPVHIWENTTQLAEVNAQRFDHFEIDQQNRLVFHSTARKDMNGTIISSSTYSYGTISIYNTHDVSLSVLSNPQQILTEGCTR